MLIYVYISFYFISVRLSPYLSSALLHGRFVLVFLRRNCKDFFSRPQIDLSSREDGNRDPEVQTCTTGSGGSDLHHPVPDLEVQTYIPGSGSRGSDLTVPNLELQTYIPSSGSGGSDLTVPDLELQTYIPVSGSGGSDLHRRFRIWRFRLTPVPDLEVQTYTAAPVRIWRFRLNGSGSEASDLHPRFRIHTYVKTDPRPKLFLTVRSI